MKKSKVHYQTVNGERWRVGGIGDEDGGDCTMIGCISPRGEVRVDTVMSFHEENESDDGNFSLYVTPGENPKFRRVPNVQKLVDLIDKLKWDYPDDAQEISECKLADIPRLLATG